MLVLLPVGSDISSSLIVKLTRASIAHIEFMGIPVSLVCLRIAAVMSVSEKYC